MCSALRAGRRVHSPVLNAPAAEKLRCLHAPRPTRHASSRDRPSRPRWRQRLSALRPCPRLDGLELAGARAGARAHPGTGTRTGTRSRRLCVTSLYAKSVFIDLYLDLDIDPLASRCRGHSQTKFVDTDICARDASLIAHCTTLALFGLLPLPGLLCKVRARHSFMHAARQALALERSAMRSRFERWTRQPPSAAVQRVWYSFPRAT